MTRGSKKGMYLRLNGDSGMAGGSWGVRMLTALVAYSALAYGMGTAAGLGQSSTMVLLLAGSYVCLAYGLVLRFRKEQWFFPAMLALFLLLVLLGGRQVLEGYRLIWNRLRIAYTAGTGRVLPQWQTQLPQSQWELCRALFVFVAGGAAALLSCLLSGCAPAALAVLVPAAVLTVMEVFDARSALPGLVSLAGAGLILAAAGWQSQKALPALGFGWMIWVVALCAAVLLAALPGVNARAEAIGMRTRKAVHTAQYETEDTTLPEGNFKENPTKKQSAQPALKVTMTDPQTMYLRGFTGCTLEENVWHPVDSAALAEDQSLLYWLNRNAFFPAAQYAAAAGGHGETGRVTVQNMGACSRYFLVPFTLCSGELLQPEDLRQDSLAAFGERTYQYSVVSGTEPEQVLENLQTSDEDWVRTFRKAESAYRGFVYRNYLQVPQEIRNLLGEQWDEIAAAYGSRENLTSPQAQTCALTFLSRAFPETGTPEELALPLEAMAGTSFQYATVAAMTLRYYGIPARYAEGYVISEKMAAGAEPGETLTLDGSCAMAWVEVYQDGIGWIPMALAPGMGEMLEPQPENGPGGGDGQSDSDQSETPPEQTVPEEEAYQTPRSQGGTVTRIARALARIGWWILLLILLSVLLWGRRKLLCRRRERRFGLENTAEAVSNIFAEGVLLLESLGISRGNGSMEPLLETVRQRFGDGYADRLAHAMELNAQALFSSHPLTQTQRESVLEFYAETRKCLESNGKWYRRLWMKWIRCLY